MYVGSRVGSASHFRDAVLTLGGYPVHRRLDGLFTMSAPTSDSH